MAHGDDSPKLNKNEWRRQMVAACFRDAVKVRQAAAAMSLGSRIVWNMSFEQILG